VRTQPDSPEPAWFSPVPFAPPDDPSAAGAKAPRDSRLDEESLAWAGALLDHHSGDIGLVYEVAIESQALERLNLETSAMSVSSRTPPARRFRYMRFKSVPRSLGGLAREGDILLSANGEELMCAEDEGLGGLLTACYEAEGGLRRLRVARKLSNVCPAEFRILARSGAPLARYTLRQDGVLCLETEMEAGALPASVAAMLSHGVQASDTLLRAQQRRAEGQRRAADALRPRGDESKRRRRPQPQPQPQSRGQQQYHHQPQSSRYQHHDLHPDQSQQQEAVEVARLERKRREATEYLAQLSQSYFQQPGLAPPFSFSNQHGQGQGQGQAPAAAASASGGKRYPSLSNIMPPGAVLRTPFDILHQHPSRPLFPHQHQHQHQHQPQPQPEPSSLSVAPTTRSSPSPHLPTSGSGGSGATAAESIPEGTSHLAFLGQAATARLSAHAQGLLRQPYAAEAPSSAAGLKRKQPTGDFRPWDDDASASRGSLSLYRGPLMAPPPVPASLRDDDMKMSPTMDGSQSSGVPADADPSPAIPQIKFLGYESSAGADEMSGRRL
jgi:hypothetical protein